MPDTPPLDTPPSDAAEIDDDDNRQDTLLVPPPNFRERLAAAERARAAEARQSLNFPTLASKDAFPVNESD